MTLTNFRASDFNNKDGKTVKTASSKYDKAPEAPKPTTQPIVAPDADPEAVPTGTTPEVLTWVGDDPERAQKALDAELENDKPRKGLVEQLAEQINKAGEEFEAVEDDESEAADEAEDK